MLILPVDGFQNISSSDGIFIEGSPDTPEMIVNMSNLLIDTSNYSLAEKKLSNSLRLLVSPEKDPRVTSEILESNMRTLQGQMKSLNKTSISDFDIQNKSGLINVEIYVNPGISTHILDPYLHPPIYQVEGWDSVNAWIEVSKIIEIAHMSEVRSISNPVRGSYGTGSVTSDGDRVHHSDLVRNSKTVQ